MTTQLTVAEAFVAGKLDYELAVGFVNHLIKTERVDEQQGKILVAQILAACYEHRQNKGELPKR